ncbi:MAG TPA: hypothetical protein VFY23_09640 [Candidatus Limnocylindrales bacterium]|nr:hypothetical protein [Candidatus Limnocylindrales bacterium]
MRDVRCWSLDRMALAGLVAAGALLAAPATALADCGVDEPRICLGEVSEPRGTVVEAWVRDAAICRPPTAGRLHLYQGAFVEPGLQYPSVGLEEAEASTELMTRETHLRFRVPALPPGGYRFAWACPDSARAEPLGSGEIEITPGVPDTSATGGGPGATTVPLLVGAFALGLVSVALRLRRA